MAPIAGSSLAPDVRALFELLAEQLNVAVGHTRLEAEFDDGRLLAVYRHEKLGAQELERLYVAPGPGGA